MSGADALPVVGERRGDFRKAWLTALPQGQGAGNAAARLPADGGDRNMVNAGCARAGGDAWLTGHTHTERLTIATHKSSSPADLR